MSSPVFEFRDGALFLRIRLTPKSSRNAINGIMTMPDGRDLLKVSVNAIPEDGKANAELLRFLSKTLKIPKSALLLVSGESSREKLIKIDRNINEVKEKLISVSED